AERARERAREDVTPAALASFSQEVLEVLAHHAVQHALLGLAAHVRLPPAAERLRTTACTAGRPRPPDRGARRDRIHRLGARRSSSVATNDGLTGGQQSRAPASPFRDRWCAGRSTPRPFRPRYFMSRSPSPPKSSQLASSSRVRSRSPAPYGRPSR